MTLTAWLSTTDRMNQRLPPHDVWSDDRWVGDDRDTSCSSSRVSVALAGVSDRNDGRDNNCTEAADAVGAANGEL